MVKASVAESKIHRGQPGHSGSLRVRVCARGALGDYLRDLPARSRGPELVFLADLGRRTLSGGVSRIQADESPSTPPSAPADPSSWINDIGVDNA